MLESTSNNSKGKAVSAADSMRRSQVNEGILLGQAQVARQQEQIKNMTEENDKLKKDIVAISGTQYDYVKADKLANLQGEVDALDRRYQFEKIRKNDLTKRYQLARIDLLHSRKMKGGVNVEKEQAEAIQRQIDILENRLDQALGKFNDALSYNKELRDNIDIIREERRVFQRVHKKMENDLNVKKRIMADRIEQSNKDMDERDGYVRQVVALQQAIAQQQEEYNVELQRMDEAMAEIKALREEQTKMQLEMEAREYEFEAQLADDNMMNTTQGLNSADNFTSSNENTQAGNKKMNSTNISNGGGGGGGKAGNTINNNNNNMNNKSGNNSSNGNDKMAAANTFSAFDNRTHCTDGNDTYFTNTNPNAANRKDMINNNNNNNNNYEDHDESTSGPSGATMLSVEHESCTIKNIVDQISKVMHHDDLAAVRAEFVSLGDKNYSLYKYINELNGTKEKLQEEIRDLTRLIDEERSTENEQRVIIAEYEEQLQNTENELRAVQRRIDTLREAISAFTNMTQTVHDECFNGDHEVVKTDEFGEEIVTTSKAKGGAAAAVNEKSTSHLMSAGNTFSSTPFIEQMNYAANSAALNAPASSRTTCNEATLISTLGAIEERCNYILCAFQRRHMLELRRSELAGQMQLNVPGIPSKATSKKVKPSPLKEHKEEGEQPNMLTTSSASEHELNREEPKSISPMATDKNDNDEENALTTTNTDSPRGELPPMLSTEDLEMEEITPVLPMAPQTVHNAVNAKMIVRLADLPTANLNTTEIGSGLLARTEVDDDHLVSHEELRRELEIRLLATREREEKSKSRKRDNKDLAPVRPRSRPSMTSPRNRKERSREEKQTESVHEDAVESTAVE